MEPEFPECPASCHDISFDDENFGPDCISKLSSPSAMCSIKSGKVQAPSESDSSQTDEDEYKAQEGFSLVSTTYRDKLKDFKE